MVITRLFFSLYEWTDDQGRKLKCVAPVYIDYAMCYIQELLTDERVFPSKTGNVIVRFPCNIKIFTPVQ